MDDDDRGRPDHAGGPKKHKVVLNLDKAVWSELEAAAEAEGVEPKELVERLVTEHLGTLPEPPEPAA